MDRKLSKGGVGGPHVGGGARKARRRLVRLARENAMRATHSPLSLSPPTPAASNIPLDIPHTPMSLPRTEDLR